MTSSYVEAASLAFGNRPFTVSEFSARIGTPRAGRLLGELKTRGLVERIGRGRYRVLSPDERPDLRASSWRRVHRLLLEARLPMAWNDEDAVRVWTGGRYTVSPSAFLSRFHIEVPEQHLDDWAAYLHAHHISTNSRRRIGTTVVITPVKHGAHTMHHGEPVIARGRTLSLIRAHRGLYADADKLVES